MSDVRRYAFFGAAIPFGVLIFGRPFLGNLSYFYVTVRTAASFGLLGFCITHTQFSVPNFNFLLDNFPYFELKATEYNSN